MHLRQGRELTLAVKYVALAHPGYRPKSTRWPYIVVAVIGGLVLLVITLAIALSKVPDHKSGGASPTFNAGTYEVGSAVPAGTYKVNCGPDNEWGHYFLRGSSNPSDVVETAMVFREVLFSAKAGQFIQVTGEQCSFTRVRD